LARAAGEGAYVEELIAQAVLRADSIDWPNVPSGERTALLLTAELVVEDDPQRAFAYLQTFEDAMQSVGTDLVYERDSRIRAFLLFSAGKTYKGLGDEAKARTLLIEAFSIFESFGYKWRAALAALALFELTGDRKWHQTAQIHASPYPNSWIAKSLRIDATLNEDDRLLLTETQREIYDALKEGLSNAEIAERLGRSSNTIRNHVRDIFRTLHVNSRVELLAKG
jgi:DNA-binding CsgD family transcriptional regulator